VVFGTTPATYKMTAAMVRARRVIARARRSLSVNCGLRWVGTPPSYATPLNIGKVNDIACLYLADEHLRVG
jgi:hypothetical protein